MKYQFFGEKWEEAASVDEFLSAHATPDLEGARFQDEEGTVRELLDISVPESKITART